MENLFSTADLCDLFLDRADGLQVLAPGLRSFGGRAAYCGQIATAAPAKPGGVVRLRDLLSEEGHGRVLVVDGHANDEWAVLGDQLVALGRHNGWAGVVLNAYVRDVRALAAIDIGVHALGAIPCRPREFGAVERGAPVSFQRVRFVPGSWLYADEDGIIVCTEEVNPRSSA
ncbi:ribonuclease E activity regulator RraA [Massilia sp. LXY-6]|uniref:ribonuclease E activity regulator RraA n=1 Tax=Massilia sp. LXY-6 TaxID=3379823 RepID=UPI003EE3A50B